MKATSYISFALGLMISFVLLGTGCTGDEDVKGCMDTNAANYDENADIEGICQYRFVRNLTVHAIPSSNELGTSWDPMDKPDVKVRFGRNSINGFSYESETAENFPGVTTLEINEEVQFTNETWKYEVLDKDVGGEFDIIATGIFNPMNNGSDNGIMITNGNTSFTFNTSVR